VRGADPLFVIELADRAQAQGGAYGGDVASWRMWGRGDMSGMVTKIVECVRNGEVIASYPLSYGKTLGPSAPPSTGALIEEAKKNLINEGIVKPPFDFTEIEFKIWDGRANR
jgi:hypothetical protein